MDSIFSSIPGWILASLALCLLGLFAMALIAFITFLVKVGVVIHEARKPPHIDAGDYHIDQGHEVRPEARRRTSAED